MDMPGLRARPALTDALLQSHRDLTDLIFGRGGGATRPHRPGWGCRTTAPHDGLPIVRSNRLLFALGEGAPLMTAQFGVKLTVALHPPLSFSRYMSQKITCHSLKIVARCCRFS